MASNKIYIQVDFQSQDAQQNITALNQQIKNIGTASEQATKQASAGVSGFSLIIEQATASISKMAATLGGMAIAAVTADFIKLGEQLLRTRFAFDRAFGPEAGDKMIQQVKALAYVAGQSSGALIKNAQDLALVFKVPQNQVVAWLKIMLDFNATLDGSTERMQAMVEIFGRAMIRGELTSKEVFKQLAALGIEAPKILEKAYGANSTELKKMLKESQGDVEKTIDIILRAMEKTSKGTAEKLAEQLPTVQFERALKPLSKIGRELFIQLAPALVEIGKFLTGLVIIITDLVKAFQKLPEPIKMAVQWLGYLVVAIVAYNTVAKIATFLTGVLGTVYTVAAGAVKVFALAQDAAAIATAAAATALGIEEAELLAIVALLTAIAYVTAPEFGNKIVKWIGGAWESVTKKAAEALAKTKEILGLSDPLKAGKPGALSYDTEGIKRALEESRNALDQARAQQLRAGKEGIAAAVVLYEEEARKVLEIHASSAAHEKVLANYRLKLAVDTTTEIIKLEEEAKQKSDKLFEETLRLRREVTIATAERMPDETYAGRKRVADIKQGASELALRDEQAFESKRIDERIDKAKEAAAAAAKIAKSSAEDLNKELARLDAVADLEKEALADKTAEAIAKHTLETEKANNELRITQEKQLREEMLQGDLAMIQRRATLEKGYLEAQRPATLAAHLETIQQAAAIDERAIQQTYQRQIEASNDALKAFERDHAESAKSIDEEQKRTGREQLNLLRDADTAMQQVRLASWKATDQAILEEQKSLFDSLKTFWEGFWDAITDRSKSIWTSLGDFFKKTIMGAFRDIATSRLAGAFMGMFGYQGPSFPDQLHPSRPYFAPLTAAPQPRDIEVTNSVLITAGNTLNGAGGALISSASALTYAAQTLAAAAGVIGGGIGGTRFGSAARSMNDQATDQVIAQSQIGGGIGGADLPTGGAGGTYSPSPPYTGSPGVTTPPFNPTGSYGRTVQNLGRTFGIGQPVQVVSGNGTVTQVPWAQATTMQQLGAIVKSPGMMSLALGAGTMIAMQGLQRGGVLGNAQTVGGAALAGIGAAAMFPALGLTYLGGGLLGAGVGLAAAGLQRGGKVGAAMTIGGGALAGAVVGTAILPGLGTLAGAAIGAGIGAVASVIRLLNPTLMERIPKEIKRIYGVNITDRGVIAQIADLVKQKYGGNLSVAVYSEEVQNLVRLYALSVGQSQAGLPRPMYGVTMAQSGVGGLQTQPVYSGGQLVQSPYSGTTTTQLSNSLLTNPLIYLQLDPQQANSLFEGRVTQVLGNNPGSVAAANTAAARNGQGRVAQASTLMEPLTVMR
jgi:hypothetical protein